MIFIFEEIKFMRNKEEFIDELSRFWDDTDRKSSNYLSAKNSVNDIEEVTNYLEALVTVAHIKAAITEQQFIVSKSNLGQIKEVLFQISTSPNLGALVSDFTPPQLLQSLLSFSVKDLEGMKTVLGLTESSVIELKGIEGNGVVDFLYQPLTGNASYYDRYIERSLPVNGDAQYCCYDNYFPVYKFIQKYFPEKTIRLVTKASEITGKYIYVVAFKYFPDFAKNNGGNYLSVVPSNVLEDCVNGKALIIYNDLAEATIFAPFVNDFKNQLVQKGLADSVMLLSGDLANCPAPVNGLQQFIQVLFFKSKKNIIHVSAINYFEEAMAYCRLNYFPEYNYTSRLKVLSDNALTLRHFICLNRSVKDYRLYISYFFYSNHLMNKAYVTQDMYKGSADLQAGFNNAALLKPLQGPRFEDFKKSLPWFIDITNMNDYQWDEVPVDAVNNSFCWVVTETSFNETLPQQSFRLTEKTYKPVAYFMPFIMIGNPYSLKEFRKAGYQTFGRWWDEGYDEIIDPVKRMAKITDIILQLSRLNQSDLMKMYREMQSVLEHNYNVLISANSSKGPIEAIMRSYQAL